MLTQQDVQYFRNKFKNNQQILDYAFELNKEISDDMDQGIENFYAKADALKLHLYLFGNVPSQLFRDYVSYVHKKLDRPNFLCGMPGVPYVEAH